MGMGTPTGSACSDHKSPWRNRQKVDQRANQLVACSVGGRGRQRWRRRKRSSKIKNRAYVTSRLGDRLTPPPLEQPENMFCLCRILFLLARCSLSLYLSLSLRLPFGCLPAASQAGRQDRARQSGVKFNAPLAPYHNQCVCLLHSLTCPALCNFASFMLRSVA